MTTMKILSTALLALLALFGTGCASDDTTAPNPTTSPVILTAGFSGSASTTYFRKGAMIDSLRIDSIIVVLQRIKFESHIDDAVADSTGQDSTENGNDANYTFKGPFIVHVRDSQSVNFAGRTLPAGIYTGIKYKIHAVRKSEQCEDSDERNRRGVWYSRDSLEGTSIAVWGTVYKNGAWVRYAFRSSLEVEYKLRGNFTLAGSTSTLTMALRFRTADWFTDLTTGALLDPADTTSENRKRIDQAIRKSFEKGRGGYDSNNDGQPDA